MDEIVLIILAAIVGGFAGGIVTLLATGWSIKASEKRLQTQLRYEDKKKALRRLYNTVEKKHYNYQEFRNTVLSLLKSFESKYLPEELKGEIRNEFRDLDKFMQERNLAPPEPTEEEYDEWMEMYMKYLKDLPDYERAEEELKSRFMGLKKSILNSISKHLEP